MIPLTTVRFVLHILLNWFLASLRVLVCYYLIIFLFIGPGIHVLSAQVLSTDAGDIHVDGSTNTELDRAQNGVPVVNIASPSAAGVSKNNFTDFNVGTQGVIMNNSKTVGTSVLGGALYANPNLRPPSDEARIILNEVTGVGRSNLYGATEIHGRQADYILANPNGITCRGCGFINTPRVSLVTGTSKMNGGTVDGFNLSNDGDVLVDGSGLNVWNGDVTNNVSYFDIITRVAKIQGDIHANELSIKTGNDYYDYRSKEITSKEVENIGDQPKLSISSSALGGMYGNKIVLESTEKGLGVNLGNRVASNLDALTITSDGDVVYQELASNRSSLTVTSKSGAITQEGFAAASGGLSLSAKKQIILNGDNPSELNGNSIYSGSELSVISDSKGEGGSGININTKIASVGDVTITTDAVINHVGELHAGHDLTMEATAINNSGDLKTVANATLSGETKIQNTGNINTGGDLTVKTGSLGNQEGSIITEGNVFMDINGNHSIEGIVSTTGDLTIKAQGDITNKTDLETVGKTVIHSVGGDFRNGYLTGSNTASHMQTAAYHDLVSDGGIDITARSIYNYGRILSGSDLTLTALDDIENRSTLRKNGGGNALQINRALMLSMGDTYLYGDNIHNKGGELLSFGDLTLAENDLNTNSRTIDNVSIKLGSHNTFSNYISSIIDADGDINIYSDRLNNRGYNYDLDNRGYFGYNIRYYVLRWYGHGYHALMREYRPIATLDTRSSFITAGNDINSHDTNIINYASSITAGNDITLTGGSLSNQSAILWTVPLGRLYGKTWTRTTGTWFWKKTRRYYHSYWTSYRTTIRSKTGPSVHAGGLLTINGASRVANGRKIDSKSKGYRKAEVLSADVSAGSQSPSSGEDTNYLNLSSLFKVASSESNYVFETNAKYISMEGLMGSRYFLDRIGYNPDLVRLAFDPFIESRLISDQVRKKLRRRFLSAGLDSDADQLAALYNNTYEEYNRLLEEEGLDLEIGDKLTTDQVKALKKDIVWLEKEQITLPDGTTKEALVSKLYLAGSSQERSDNALLGGRQVDIHSAGDFVNTGSVKAVDRIELDFGGTVVNAPEGEMMSEGGLSLKSDQDIVNIGGKISSGKDMEIHAEGNVINQNLKIREGSVDSYIDQVISNGIITSGGDLNIDSGNDIIFQGTKAVSKRDMALTAGNQVHITTDVLAHHKKSSGGSSRSEHNKITHKGSSLSSEGDLSITSVGDLKIKGSSLKASGNGKLESLARDVSVEHAVNATETHTVKEKRGFFSSSCSEVYDYKETAVASHLDFGGDLLVKTDDGDITVVGSEIKTAGSLDVEGVEDFKIKAAELKNEHWEKHQKKGLFVGGGIYGEKHRSASQKATRLKGSISDVAGDMGIDASGDITIEASEISVDGKGDLRGENIMVTSKAEREEKRKASKEVSYGGISVGFKGGGLNVGLTGEGVGDKTISKTSTQKRSDLKFGSLNVEAEEDVTLIASTVTVSGDADVNSGGDIKLLNAHDTEDTTEEHTELDVELGVRVGNVFVDAVNSAKGLKQAKKVLNKANKRYRKIEKLYQKGKASDKALSLAKAQVALAASGVATATNNLAESIKNSGNAGTAAGMTLSGYINTEYNTNTERVESSDSRGSAFIVKGDADLKSGGTLDMVGSDLASISGDLSVGAEKIDIRSGLSSYEVTSKQRSGSMGVSIGNGGVSTNAGYSQSDNWRLLQTHTNSYLGANEGTVTLKSKDDIKIVGGNVVGNEVKMDVGGDLLIETVQDTYEETGSGFGMNISGTPGSKSKDENQKTELIGMGINMSLKDVQTKTTNQKSGIVALSTHDKALNDQENLKILLSSSDVDIKGNTTLNTEKEDTEFTDADFEGQMDVPVELLKKGGVKELIESYKGLVDNAKASVAGVVTTVTDAGKTVSAQLKGDSDLNLVEDFKQRQENSRMRINIRKNKKLANVESIKEAEEILNTLSPDQKISMYANEGEMTMVQDEETGQIQIGTVQGTHNQNDHISYVNVGNVEESQGTKDPQNVYDVLQHELNHNVTRSDEQAEELVKSAKFADKVMNVLSFKWLKRKKKTKNNNPRFIDSKGYSNEDRKHLAENAAKVKSIEEKDKDYLLANPLFVEGAKAIAVGVLGTAVVNAYKEKIKDAAVNAYEATKEGISNAIDYVSEKFDDKSESNNKKQHQSNTANSPQNNGNKNDDKPKVPKFSSKLKREKEKNHYAPNRELPRDKYGNPKPDPVATGPHTQLGVKDGRKGKYNQAREFGIDGKPIRDIDFTDHGRPQNHPNPHQHKYNPNPTGGTLQRSKTPLPLK